MCGITGWLSRDSSAPVEEAILARMRDAVRHRGPDGEGLWISPDRRMGLAFRRLAIVDLSAAANQPMSNEDGSVRIVFNGEIYNHRRLRPELEARGHRFATDHADTEVIVHGYEEWGEDVVHRLDGMFAIAIWDERQRRLFLARDRVGIKPLYFAWTPRRLPVRLGDQGAPRAPRGVGRHRADVRLPLPLVPDDARPAHDVPRHLQAARRLPLRSWASTARSTADRYWDALPGAGAEAVEMRGLLRGRRSGTSRSAARASCLDAAVEKRMMSDVPFGVLLSGGIDSSTNVALMAGTSTARCARSRSGSRTTRAPERALLRAHDRQGSSGTDHHEVLVDEKAMREYLPSLVYLAGRADRGLGLHPALLRLEARARQRDHRRPGRRRERRAVLRLPVLHGVPRDVPPLLAAVLAAAAGRPPRRGAGRALVAGVHDRHDRYLDVVVRAGRGREPFWSGATVFSGGAQGAARRPRPARAAPRSRRSWRDRACCRRRSRCRTATRSCARSSGGSTSARRARDILDADELLGVQAPAAGASPHARRQDRHVRLDRAARAVPRPQARRVHDEPADGS